VGARGRAEGALQRRHRRAGEVAHGLEPQPEQHLLGLLPDPPERADRQRVQEGDHAVGRDDEQAVGLAPGEASLATNFVDAMPTEQVMALLVVDGGPDLLADGGRPAEPPRRTADVEERLVERDRLDERRDRAEDLHHPRPRRARRRRGRGRRRWPAGRAGERASSAWRCARRRRGLRTSPTAPHRACPRRRR
jgi:hypothetical protein